MSLIARVSKVPCGLGNPCRSIPFSVLTEFKLLAGLLGRVTFRIDVHLIISTMLQLKLEFIGWRVLKELFNTKRLLPAVEKARELIEECKKCIENAFEECMRTNELSALKAEICIVNCNRRHQFEPNGIKTMTLCAFFFYCLQLTAVVIAENALSDFAQQLISRFEEQSKAKLLDEPFKELRSKLHVRSEDPRSALDSARIKLEKLFADRTKALQMLTRTAEDSAQYYATYNSAEFSTPLDESVCAKFEQLLNDSDVRIASNSVIRTSGVHVSIESYRCDPKVIRDFSWTGTEKIENVMAENKRADETMRHQFIGTYSGVTRMYPRRYWRVEPSPITIDLFDPKFRPWFVNTESAPKDIVFLIDYSGSVKGPTMHLIKITMMYILSTLSPNDYFFGVYFNSVFAPILNCSGGTFLPATTSNKKIFFERLGQIEEKDQAHVSPPLKFSLDALRGAPDRHCIANYEP
ncbi:hypothetical protein KIN20_001906 [Parelaphostrongylus tenuis]|uniref:VWA N-terminal domain-containing protein n=1 Tax=Parelaphostrongylus tenuis TaxID=148309 RepID=A0AAD5MDH6_PARTN|nr:hypothetical protein KIN20_001906 [Parelaphostrongylus tenuis]